MHQVVTTCTLRLSSLPAEFLYHIRVTVFFSFFLRWLLLRFGRNICVRRDLVDTLQAQVFGPGHGGSEGRLEMCSMKMEQTHKNVPGFPSSSRCCREISVGVTTRNNILPLYDTDTSMDYSNFCSRISSEYSSISSSTWVHFK